MRIPGCVDAASAADWRRIVEDVAGAHELVVVHTPSAAKFVEANFSWHDRMRRFEVLTEPAAETFAELERNPVSSDSIVVGIGGGKALDAAKVVAQWKEGESVNDLKRCLVSGGVVDHRPRPLILAPSIASSGSEASKAAILSMGDIKTGLRGECLIADQVILDGRLWQNLDLSTARHFAFDVFAHLVETTVSMRRSSVSMDHARQGMDRLQAWLFRGDSDLRNYREAMVASFDAGVCLATSSTCLPHRVQYVVGPATGTTHVEGIWYLSRPWIRGLQSTARERYKEVEEILGFGSSDGGLMAAFDRAHTWAAALVRQDRFQTLQGRAATLAARVTGDLDADPTYTDRRLIEQLIFPND